MNLSKYKIVLNFSKETFLHKRMIEVNQKNKQKKIVSLFSKNRNEKKQNRNK